MEKVFKALSFVQNAHQGQLYGGCMPYTHHLTSVYSAALDCGCTDEDILAACLLHDVLEDTHYSYSKLKSLFGERVAEIVFRVTDELARNRKERKALTYPKIVSMWESVFVKLCDRIANVKYSLENGDRGKLNMYKSEHDEFERLLSGQYKYEPINLAWSSLNQLMKNSID